jgi:phosphate transport system ATP-binding protein
MSQAASDKPVIRAENFDLFYGTFQALKGISMSIPQNRVTAIIGPSGCGKSTFLRSINRMNDLYGVTTQGQIFVEEMPVYGKTDLVELRKKVGMVFQRPNPFPLSIFENVAFGLKVHSTLRKSEIMARVQKSMEGVALWEELKDRMDESALVLSGEQQQRLCIARSIAVNPDVLLMDEPCSALDPLATQHIEELIRELKEKYTILIVTHNMAQAARVSNVTAYFYLGKLIEMGPTQKIFTAPECQETEDYITGRFG